MNKIKLISTLLIVLLGFGLFAAVPQAAAQNDTINFGYVQWPGVTVKTHVAAKVAEYLGYETKMTAAPETVIFKSLENKEEDAEKSYLKTIESLTSLIQQSTRDYEIQSRRLEEQMRYSRSLLEKLAADNGKNVFGVSEKRSC